MNKLDYDKIKAFIEPYIAKASVTEIFGSFSEASLIKEPIIKKNILSLTTKSSIETPSYLVFFVVTNNKDIQLLITIKYKISKSLITFISLENDKENLLAKSIEIVSRFDDKEIALLDGFMSNAKALEIQKNDDFIFYPINENFDVNAPLQYEDLIKIDSFKI